MEVLHPEASLVDAATRRRMDGAEIEDRVRAATEGLGSVPPGVIFLLAAGTLPVIVTYIATRRSDRAVALLDPALPEGVLTRFVERYRPAAVIGETRMSGAPGYTEWTVETVGSGVVRSDGDAAPVHDDVSLLLATSGSTGDARLVRLSREAIETNTAAIIDVLAIDPSDVAVTSLPIFYSYGMSVLNTHLAAGATLVVTADGLVTRPFWTAVDALGVTTLPLVPMQFEMLRRIRFDPASHPSVRSVTQAGGRLATQSVIEFHDRLSAIGARLFVMYGQTEGGPRLTTLPPARLPGKAGSVGPALPGGTIRIETGDEPSSSTMGEVVYRGRNVMMGYADEAADLARGDDMGGVLHTGDLGHLDDEGYLTIDGRTSRLGKAFGIRLNLDDIERMLAGLGAIAATPGDDRVIVWVEASEPVMATEAVTSVARRLRIHPTGFVVRTIDRLPLLPNGKVDYQALGRSS